MQKHILLSLVSFFVVGFGVNAIAAECPTIEKADISKFYQALASKVFLKGTVTGTADDKYVIMWKGTRYFIPAGEAKYLSQDDVIKMGQVGINSVTLERQQSLTNRIQCYYKAEMISRYAPGTKIEPFKFRMTYLIK